MNKNDINKLFEKINPGDDKKADIYNKIIDKKINSIENNAEEAKNNGSIRQEKYRAKSKRLRLIMSLSLVLILSITVFAVSNSYQDFSYNVIDWSVSEDATQINISDSNNGYKVTAESLFGDSKVVYVIFSIEREDGKKIKIREKDERTRFAIETSREYIGTSEGENISDSMSYYALNTMDEKSEKVYFLRKYSTDLRDRQGRTLIGENLHLEISGLYLGLFGRAIKGNWTLDIPLEYKDLGQTYVIDEEFEYEGKVAKLEKIHHSPLDITVYFTSEEGALEDMTLKNFNEEHYVDIRLKDGNYIPETTESGGGDNLGSYYYKQINTVVYGEIRLDDIKSIVVGDVEIPINFE